MMIALVAFFVHVAGGGGGIVSQHVSRSVLRFLMCTLNGYDESCQMIFIIKLQLNISYVNCYAEGWNW